MLMKEKIRWRCQIGFGWRSHPWKKRKTRIINKKRIGNQAWESNLKFKIQINRY